MSIRRKQRQRGKRKEIRREALKTWDRLAQTAQPPRKYDSFPSMSSVIIPTIRRVIPNTIAKDLVGVQPMMVPPGMIGNAASGVEPVSFHYRYDTDGNRTKKEISEQRKKERKAKKRNGVFGKRERCSLEEINWDNISFRAD